MSLKKYVLVFSLLSCSQTSFAQTIETSKPQYQTLAQCTSEVQDRDIDTQIRMLFDMNPILKTYKLSSKTHNKVVTLYGSVANSSEKELASDLASLVEYIALPTNH